MSFHWSHQMLQNSEKYDVPWHADDKTMSPHGTSSRPNKQKPSARQWAKTFPNTQEPKQHTYTTTKESSCLQQLRALATLAPMTKCVMPHITSQRGPQESIKRNKQVLHGKCALSTEFPSHWSNTIPIHRAPQRNAQKLLRALAPAFQEWNHSPKIPSR